LATELEFGSDEHDPPQDDLEETQDETEVEAEPEPEVDPTEARFETLETGLNKIIEYIQAQSQAPQAKAEAAAPARPRPDFGDNTVAAYLYDELQELRKEMKEPWRRIEQERAEAQQAEAAFSQLKDDASRYIDSRTKQGDPDVPFEDLAKMLVSMGQLRDRRISMSDALKNAYNAVAFDAMRDSARTRGLQDARKPDAKIPAPIRRIDGSQRPQARPQVAAKPEENPANRLKRQMEQANARLEKLTPEEIEEAFGN
jgi:hypothetical protein